MSLTAYQHRLTLSLEQQKKLGHANVIFQRIDDEANSAQEAALSVEDIVRVKKLMQEVIGDDEELQAKIGLASKEESIFHLVHDDNDVLNLPWHLALEDHVLISVTKGINELSEESKKIQLPLKILAFLTSPTGEDPNIYNEEKRLLLSAVSPHDNRLVEIDFTEDGSLESLERSLTDRRYDMVYYSGHGNYEDGKTYLQVEEKLNGAGLRIEASQFIKILADSNNVPEVVILSSCKTAAGKAREEFEGVTHQLLSIGVSAVIAYGLSMFSDYASDFISKFFFNLLDQKSFIRSYYEALRQLYQSEYIQYGKSTNHNIGQKEPCQWLIPQLFLSKKVAFPIDWQSAPEAFIEDPLPFIKSSVFYSFIRKHETIKIEKCLEAKKNVMISGYSLAGKSALGEYALARFEEKYPKACVLRFVEGHSLESFQYLLSGKINKEIGQSYEALGHEFDVLNHQDKPVVVLIDNLDEKLSSNSEGPQLESEFYELTRFLLRYEHVSTILIVQDKLKDLSIDEEIELSGISIPEQSHIFRKTFLADYLSKVFPKRSESTFYSANNLDLVLRELFGKGAFGGIIGTYELFEYSIWQEPQKEMFDQERDFVNAHEKHLFRAASVFIARSKLEEKFKELTAYEVQVFSYLRKYSLAVSNVALLCQGLTNPELKQALMKLISLCLVERYSHGVSGETVYYINELIKFTSYLFIKNNISFDHEAAGDYYWNFTIRFSKANWRDLQESYFHFCSSNNVKKLCKAGKALCDFHYRNGYYNDTRNVALEVHEKTNGNANAEIYKILFVCYKNIDPERAQSFNDIYKKKCLTESDDLGFVAALHQDALLKERHGQLNLAREKNIEALNLARKLPHDQRSADLKVSILTTMSHIHRNLASYRQAHECLIEAKKAIEYFEDIDTKNRSLAYTLDNLALFYSETGDFDRALSCTKQVLNIANAYYIYEIKVSAISKMGSIYQKKGDYKSAEFWHDEAILQACKNLGKHDQAYAYNSKGHLYLEWEKFQEALQVLHLAHQLSRETTDVNFEAVILNNLGSAYNLLGDYLSAASMLEQALALTEKHRLPNQFSILNMLTSTYDNNKDYERALHFAQRHLRVSELHLEIDDIYMRDGYVVEKFIALTNISQILIKMNEVEKVKDFGVQAYQWFFDTNPKFPRHTAPHSFAYIGVFLGRNFDFPLRIKILETVRELSIEFSLPYLDEALELINHK